MPHIHRKKWIAAVLCTAIACIYFFALPSRNSLESEAPEVSVKPLQRRAVPESTPPSKVDSEKSSDIVLPTILGTVFDNLTGAPIPKFELRGLLDGHLVASRFINDPAGVFEVSDLPDGDLTLEFIASGFDLEIERFANLRSGDVFVGLRVGMEPVVEVHGIVLGPNNEAVPNARIFLREIPPPPLREFRTVAITDESGQFALYDVFARTKAFAADHPDYDPVMTEVELERDRENYVALRLDKGTVVHGRVTRGEVPIKSRYVKASFENGSPSQMSAITDSDGWYRFDSFTPGNVRITCDTYVDTLVNPGELVRVDFDLSKRAGLEGQVFFDRAGPHCDGCTTNVAANILTPDGHNYMLRAESDRTGAFSFEPLPAGSAAIQYSYHYVTGERFTFYTEVELIDGETMWLDLYPSETRPCRIVIVDLPMDTVTIELAIVASLDSPPLGFDPIVWNQQHTLRSNQSTFEVHSDGERVEVRKPSSAAKFNPPKEFILDAQLPGPGAYQLRCRVMCMDFETDRMDFFDSTHEMQFGDNDRGGFIIPSPNEKPQP